VRHPGANPQPRAGTFGSLNLLQNSRPNPAAFGSCLTHFHDMVFNHPTLAEAYKVAALDGLNKL